MQLELPETWEQIGTDAILQDERRLIALLEAVAIKLNRSVDSVRRELSLDTLNKPRSKSKLEKQGSKIAWIDLEHVSEPGEYKFRDGIIRIKRKHQDAPDNATRAGRRAMSDRPRGTAATIGQVTLFLSEKSAARWKKRLRTVHAE
jgi:hypothetical protein